MNLRILWSLVGIAALGLGWFWWSFLRHAPGKEPLLEYMIIAVALGMAITFLWALFSVLVAYVVVPKADALIDPHQTFDDLLFRHFRAVNYGGACTFQWANRRTLDFDCRTLPAEIRYPLMIQFITLLLGSLLMFGGATVLWAMGELWT